MVVGGKYVVVAIVRSEGIGEMGSEGISLLVLVGVDTDYVTDSLSVSHAGSIDEIDTFDGFRVDAEHFIPAYYDVIDSNLYIAFGRGCLDAVECLVHADAG